MIIDIIHKCRRRGASIYYYRITMGCSWCCPTPDAGLYVLKHHLIFKHRSPCYSVVLLLIKGVGAEISETTALIQKQYDDVIQDNEIITGATKTESIPNRTKYYQSVLEDARRYMRMYINIFNRLLLVPCFIR